MPPAGHSELDERKLALAERLFAADTRVGILGSQVTATATPLARRIPMHGNVVGFGFGAKVTDDRASQQTALRVYVRTKLPRNLLRSAELVPDEVDGLQTDVIAVGDVTIRQRPVRCGVSIGHPDVTAGTLGCLVHVAAGDEPHILSNNHVMANVNRAQLGDEILEPGAADGGTEPIAELSDFEPIRLDGDDNAIDAAIARVLDPADVEPEIEVIGGVPQDPTDAVLYQSVRKHGRTSRHTVGVIMDVSADLWVRVLPQEFATPGAGAAGMAWFTDQFAVVGVGGDFSQPGDSGSLVVDGVTRAPVGLLFAGGADHTFANRIGPVLTRFDATIVEGSAPR